MVKKWENLGYLLLLKPTMNSSRYLLNYNFKTYVIEFQMSSES